MLLLAMECVILCIMFTIVTVSMIIKNPLAELHNLHPDIQRRLHALPEYEGKIGLNRQKTWRMLTKIMDFT
mgnify:CR=1 FL=1